jgi:hypothetical protein
MDYHGPIQVRVYAHRPPKLTRALAFLPEGKPNPPCRIEDPNKGRVVVYEIHGAVRINVDPHDTG